MYALDLVVGLMSPFHHLKRTVSLSLLCGERGLLCIDTRKCGL